MSDETRARDPQAALDGSVAETLRDVAAPAAVYRDEYRPIFAELQVFPSGGSVAVDVTLTLAGRIVTARAEGAGDERGVGRTAAEAVLDCLEIYLDGIAELELAWFKVLEPEGHFGHTVVHCAVAAKTGGGRELYVGSALSRGDLSVAAVRSALDAMNRPFARMLAGHA